MFRLLKLFLVFNPFRLFALGRRVTSFRRKLQILGVLFAVTTALHIHIMPDWLASLLGNMTGTPTATPGNRGATEAAGFAAGEDGLFGGIMKKLLGDNGGTASSQPAQTREFVSAPPRPSGALSRGDLFAAFANLNLRPEQVNRLPDSPASTAEAPPDARWRRIEKALDGDTLLIDGKTVRLIGIDAPESGENDHLFRELDRMGAREQLGDMLALGKLAARFLKQAEGRDCWLEYENEKRDQYGRILAYVHLDDGTNLNEVIVYQGFAKVYLGANFRYAKRFIFLQNEAMKRRNGLWAER